ncbi:hypothetical protein QAD02_015129 [Eretmocerus hayati]|uniref:Uncharacterized protein n=1 Tax=Eretmocerus hayati TaxID=131215 RepID=A0ACC2P7T1_9HYME|nr:hypothetical protein QAD02_015129 [Eretmocerus hayati]
MSDEEYTYIGGTTEDERESWTIQIPDQDIEAAYPSEFFSRTPKEKPKASFRGGNMDLKNAAAMMLYYMKQKLNPPAAVVNSILYLYFKDKPEILTEDWNSFGITIGKKDESVNPWSILDIEHSNEAIPGAVMDQTVKSEDYKPLVCYALAGHRLGRISTASVNTAYYEEIRDRIKN